jgi:hypothetical protein
MTLSINPLWSKNSSCPLPYARTSLQAQVHDKSGALGPLFGPVCTHLARSTSGAYLGSPDIALLRLFSSWPLFGWETRSDSLYPGGCAPREQLGWREIEVVDEDLGRSAAGTVTRAGFERMVAAVCLGKVGAVAAREVSRFARNSREWQQLVEVCRIVDTL